MGLIRTVFLFVRGILCNRIELAAENHRTFHLLILCPMLAPFAASNSSVDCCDITIALQPERWQAIVAKWIFERKPVQYSRLSWCRTKSLCVRESNRNCHEWFKIMSAKTVR